jgi:hypothetical protein
MSDSITNERVRELQAFARRHPRMLRPTAPIDVMKIRRRVFRFLFPRGQGSPPRR